MDRLLPILIGASISFGFFYENLKLNKKIKKLVIQNEWYSKRFIKHHQMIKKAILEREYYYKNYYQAQLWQVDSEVLVRELLQRRGDDGKPLFIPLCIPDSNNNNLVVSLLSRKRIKLGS